MTPESTIRALLAKAEQAAGDRKGAEARVAARVAWVTETMAKLRAAQQRADQAWDRLLASLPEDLDEEELEAIPEPPEQAELDALHAEIAAVRDHDRWPRHLYWSL